MKVKLLKNVTEDGNLKVAKRRNRNWHPPRIEKNDAGEVTSVIESDEEEFTHIPYTKGTVIEMSEESGNKYIEKGLATEVVEEKKDEPTERSREAESGNTDGGKSSGRKRPR